jgi:hypothetical protein
LPQSLGSSTTRTDELASLPLSLAILQNPNVGKAWLLTKVLLKLQDKLPLCVACQFGSAHQRPWCTKGKKSGSIQKPDQTKPGDGVPVDQNISAQPGIIPQMAGFLTSKRIWGCTMFIDHVSDYIHVHLMKDFTTIETLLAKLAFKILCTKADCSVKHYQMNSLLPAIISTKPLSFAELVHTIKKESSKRETNSWHKQLEFSCYMA